MQFKVTEDTVYKKIKKQIPIIIYLIFISVMILYNLDGTYLWKDEAGTANVSCNILKYGVPKVYDGVNLLSTSDGNNFNSALLVSNHEWLQYYICALSFLIFGKTTFAARFPFALFAIASIYVMWLLGKKLYKNVSLSLLVCCIYSLNVQFLLYARQARYYSLVLFFTSLTVLLFFYLCDTLCAIKKKTNKVIILYLATFLSSTMLFMSSRLGGLVLLFATIFYALLTREKRTIKAGLPILLSIVPWCVWFCINNIILQAPSFGGSAFETHVFAKLLLVIWKVQVYFLPMIILALFVAIFQLVSVIRGTGEKKLYHRDSLYFFLIVSCNIIATVIPRWGIVNHYYLPILVAAPFIIIPVFKLIYDNSHFVSIIFIMIAIFTNIFNILPYALLDNISSEKNEVNNLLSDQYSWTTNYGVFASPDTNANFRTTSLSEYKDGLHINCYLIDYIHELQNGYYSSIQEICEHINSRAKPTDTVLMIGVEYEPIIFYTNLRIVNNLTTGVQPWPDYFNAYPNQDKYSNITQLSDESIDWIIVTTDYPIALFMDDSNYLNKNRDSYDIYRSTTDHTIISNSADLDYHKFRKSDEGSQFTIWYRKSG